MNNITKELLDYFGGDELASSAWYNKYRNDSEVTPDDMHLRMAREFAKVENKYISEETILRIEEPYVKDLSNYGKHRSDLNEESIYKLFKDFKYLIPQGSVMSQLGNESSLGSISNCVVIPPPHDSYGGIMKADEQLAQLMKMRCGVGTDISKLRPSTAKVSNSAKTSTGAVSFMDRFSNTTREVAQGGRRGALMLSMDVKHPDILDFIQSKRDLSKITGANISVKMTDDFLNAVKNDEVFTLRFPVDRKITDVIFSDQPMNVLIRVSDKDGEFYIRRVKAKEIYDEFIKSNWLSAEPGLLLWDNVIAYSPESVYEEYIQSSTNPCSEIAMQPNDTCRLIVMNLTSFVSNPYTKSSNIDYNKLYSIAYEQQRLADDIVDLEIGKVDKILDKINNSDDAVSTVEKEIWEALRQTALNGRRTGCGFTGLGDMLAMLGLNYDSDEALAVVDKVMRIKMKAELDCTIDLSLLRGSFKGWNASLEDDGNIFYETLGEYFPEQYDRMMAYGRRNISWSTVAPTGTVSMMTQTTSGIEPLFKTHYIRRKKVNNNDGRIDFTDTNGDSFTEYPIFHKGLFDWWKAIHADEKNKLEDIDKGMLNLIIENSPYYNSTAEEINWEKRIKLQSIVQRYTTHSISSTINLPSDCTEEEISNIYIKAWENGLKGITIYRDGCRDGILISSEVKEEELDYKDSVKRPKKLNMELHHVTAKGERFTIIIGLLKDKPYEIFALRGEIGKHHISGLVKKLSGGRYDIEQGDITIEDITNEMSSAEIALTRLVSMGLRHRVNVKYIVEQLDKSGEFITSFSKAMGRTLKKYIPDGEKIKLKCSNPDCTGSGDNVIFEEGCSKCLDCGTSACS